MSNIDKAAEKQTPEEIVQESFRGLDELIKDPELRDWYKRLIVTCIKEVPRARGRSRKDN